MTRRATAAALLAQPLDDLAVESGSSTLRPTNGSAPGGEAARLVDRARAPEAGALADREVLLAVAGRGVHEPGAVLHADVRRAVHDRSVVAPRPSKIAARAARGPCSGRTVSAALQPASDSSAVSRAAATR